MSHYVDCPKCGQEIDVTDCNFPLACDEYDHECPHCESELLVGWEATFSARLNPTSSDSEAPHEE